jgi:hypothetical protein
MAEQKEHKEDKKSKQPKKAKKKPKSIKQSLGDMAAAATSGAAALHATNERVRETNERLREFTQETRAARETAQAQLQDLVEQVEEMKALLADRTERGLIQSEEALQIAQQVADTMGDVRTLATLYATKREITAQDEKIRWARLYEKLDAIQIEVKYASKVVVDQVVSKGAYGASILSGLGAFGGFLHTVGGTAVTVGAALGVPAAQTAAATATFLSPPLAFAVMVGSITVSMLTCEAAEQVEKDAVKTGAAWTQAKQDSTDYYAKELALRISVRNRLKALHDRLKGQVGMPTVGGQSALTAA